MVGIELNVAPSVLVWARESIGLSREQAAARIDAFPSTLQLWEEGQADPTLPQLRRMAEVYQRPLAAFFLSAPPEETESVTDFRLASETHGQAWSPELHRAFRRVRMQREVAIELAELREEEPGPIELVLRLDLDPEIAGDRVRAWLGASPPLAVSGAGGALNTWVSLIERKSILVTQVQGVDLHEMRGLSIGDQPFPIIVLNGKDTPAGKLFTVLHELVHVLLRSGGLCDLKDDQGQPRTPTEQAERYCNRVAAATLVPRSALMGLPVVAAASASTVWTDSDLRWLANRFGVSAEAMLLRLVFLGCASEDDYRRRRKLFLSIYAARQERLREASGGPSYYRMTLRDFGRRYVGMVLDAYRQEDINGSEVADYLDIKLDNLPKLEQAIEAGR
jgi:Zn-dependent peptidase ImmA (M78 family)/transcriptional regulator with XRE-family HTH domain